MSMIAEEDLPVDLEDPAVEDIPAPAPDTGYDIPPPPVDGVPERKQVITAFLVYIDLDGKSIAHSDLSEPLDARRPATLEDFRRAGREIADDVTTAVTVQALMGAQMQMARQAQEQHQRAQVAAQLAQEGGNVFRGGKLL
jgi:hypothetical protein